MAVPQQQVQLVDYTITLNGSVQNPLPYRLDRGAMLLQAPAASSVTFSFTNSTPSVGGAGCFTLAAGAILQLVPAPVNPMYCIGTNAAVFVIQVSGG